MEEIKGTEENSALEKTDPDKHEKIQETSNVEKAVIFGDTNKEKMIREKENLSFYNKSEEDKAISSGITQSLVRELMEETAQAVRSPQKELDETKAYIDILMKELEQTRQEISAVREISKKKKKNLWKGLALFELLALVTGGCVFGVWYTFRDTTDTKQAENSGIPGQQLDGNVNHKKTVKTVENLSQLITQLSAEEIAPFEATIENLFGYEYLCFSYKQLRVYYRNEYLEKNDTNRQKIMIDNGTKMVECNWDFDWKLGLGALCPKFGSYSNDSSNQLLFINYSRDEDNMPNSIPEEIRMIDTDKLWEYETVSVRKHMENLFNLEYTQVFPGANGKNDTRMHMTINSANYQYSIKEDVYTDAVYNGEQLLKFNDYFKMEMLEDGIKIDTVVYLSEQELLGELTGKIVLKDGKLGFDEVKYGAYVNADQEDPGSDPIITPRETRPVERAVILGNNKERYLIELSNIVQRNEYLNENFVNKNGYRTYQENGAVTSIMGIDVSKYQAKINWKKVKDAGVEFAILRLGYRGFNEGTLEMDEYFEDNIKGATEAGVNVGIYFFSQAVTVEEAVEEAQMVLENIKDYPINYPVIFDTEVVTTYDARANHLTREERTDITIAFCEEIKKAGYHPMFYANTKWMIMGLNLERLTEYDRWFAYYGDTISFPYHFDMLQYSDTGRIPGISGNVDLNISFVDYTKLLGGE